MAQKEIISKIAKYFSISESDIDHSLVPLFLSIMNSEIKISNKMNENRISIEKVLAEHSRTSEQLSEKIKGSITTHQYSNTKAKTAFMIRWGWTIPASIIVLTIFFTCVYNNYVHKAIVTKYKSIENSIERFNKNKP
jgi:hypothetical protein